MSFTYNLCGLCENDKHCTFPHLTGRPSLHCGEFVSFSRPQKPKPTETFRTSSDKKVYSVREEEGKKMGLCRTCDKRENCTFPRAEGGVWHCEEFC